MDAVLPQVRRIAVLVKSLDPAAGRQLLLAMPTQLAKQVRQALNTLTRIDPEEQRQILAEFRAQAMSPASSPASHTRPNNPQYSQTPLSASNPTTSNLSASSHSMPMNSSQGSPGARGASNFPHSEGIGAVNASSHSHTDALYSQDISFHDASQAVSPSSSWKHLDTESLSEFLAGERATVVAVVISQLPAPQAVALLEHLAPGQRDEVISKLTRLREIDREAMAAIDEHLAGRISDYHHQRSSENESVSRFQSLLSVASTPLREQLQNSICESDAHLAKQLGLVPTSGGSVPQRPVTSLASRGPSQDEDEDDSFNPAIAALKAAGHPLISASQNQRKASSPPATRANATGGRTPSSSMEAQSNLPPGSSRGHTSRLEPSNPSTSTGKRPTPSWESLANHVITTADENAIWTDDEMPDVLPFPTRSPSVAKQRLSFEQIVDLTPEQITVVLSAVEGEVLLLALAGATIPFMQRFHSMLSKSDSRAIHQQLRNLGPINLQDVDAAQQLLSDAATRLIYPDAAGENADSMKASNPARLAA